MVFEVTEVVERCFNSDWAIVSFCRGKCADLDLREWIYLDVRKWIYLDSL